MPRLRLITLTIHPILPIRVGPLVIPISWGLAIPTPHVARRRGWLITAGPPQWAHAAQRRQRTHQGSVTCETWHKRLPLTPWNASTLVQLIGRTLGRLCPSITTAPHSHLKCCTTCGPMAESPPASVCINGSTCGSGLVPPISSAVNERTPLLTRRALPRQLIVIFRRQISCPSTQKGH